MLCAECKRKFPKWKAEKRDSRQLCLCLSCQHSQSRQLQVKTGKRPTAVAAWNEYQKEKEEDRVRREYNTDAFIAWLEK